MRSFLSIASFILLFTFALITLFEVLQIHEEIKTLRIENHRIRDQMHSLILLNDNYVRDIKQKIDLTAEKFGAPKEEE